MPKQKTITPEEVVTAALSWQTSAVIQLGYKLQDILKERAEELKTKAANVQSQKDELEEELNSITTALKQQG